MSTKKMIFSIACIVGILSTLLFFLKDFNLSWVEIRGDTAIVTINFLMPMQQDDLQAHIQIENNPIYDNNYTYDFEWLNQNTCEVRITEASTTKGQKINLHIRELPTQYEGLKKSSTIPIQFKTSVEIKLPPMELLVATIQPFQIHFNTPMNKQNIHKYIEADAEFFIEPIVKYDQYNNPHEDLTTFVLTPKQALNNDANYVISLREGMPAMSGALLEKSEKFVIQTDKKPTIHSTTPSTGDRWIGLYPRMTLESGTPMAKAYLKIDGHTLEGTLKNDFEATFYPKSCLKPNTKYTAQAWIVSNTGEMSEQQTITFETVPIKSNRIWMEVITEGTQCINVYRGNEKIQSFPCSTGKKGSETPLGTYYTQGKQDSYVNESLNYGTNYCTELTEGIRIHGLIRDAYWTVQPSSYERLGTAHNSPDIALKDEDAAWIYDNVPYETLVIIHPGH